MRDFFVPDPSSHPTEGRPEPLSAQGEKLIGFALQGAQRRERYAFQAANEGWLSDFLQTYREWIASTRGALGSREEQVDQWHMLVRCMITARTIGEAVEYLVRFGRIIWGDRSPAELRRGSREAELVLNEPYRAGPEGLIAVIWMLSLILCELEFLANRSIHGASAAVVHTPCLPDGVAQLLFPAPLAYEQSEASLRLPIEILDLPVVAAPADLPDFFRQLMPLTLGARQEPFRFARLVYGLIRNDKCGPEYGPCNRESIARRLGLSVATLQRRLRADGETFQRLRDLAYNDLAISWLTAGVAAGEIADRLGFSDPFAFRRFFVRNNGASPTAFRKRALGL